MKVIINSENTQALGIGSNPGVVVLKINTTDTGYSLHIRASNLALMEFETDTTLEGIQAKTVPIIAALEAE